MRALLNDYNTADAMKVCWEAYQQHTESPDTLFEGAKIFMEKGYYKEANELYARIMELFDKDLAAWSEAAWQQAVIYEEYLNQPEQTTALLRQLVHKAPLTELGRRAGARLQREMLALNPTESDAFYKKRM
jgi:tetratricopeptide (TPR) repeat protein